MKISFIHDDEAWFWVLDETGRTWEAWYEVDDEPAIRLHKSDRTDVFEVSTLIAEMSFEAQQALVNA